VNPLPPVSISAPQSGVPSWWVAAFVVAVVAAFAPAISAPFVHDDIDAIVRNESIRSLTPPSVPLSPPPETSVSGRPLVNLSLAATFAANEVLGVAQRPGPGGPHETTGYHVGNLLLHLACGLLLFSLLRLTLARAQWRSDGLSADSLAGVATFVWLIHPIQTATVDYVIARTEQFVSLFLLLTLYAAARGWNAPDDSGRFRWHLLAVLACALGMASKEVMVVAPLLLLLYDRAFVSVSWRSIVSDRGRVVLYAAMIVVVATMLPLVALGARKTSVGFDLGMSWTEYAYSQGWVVARYLRLLVWPQGLAFDYGDRPIGGLLPVPGLLVLAAAGAAGLMAWRSPRWRWAGFAAAWFFVILAPSSSVVPIRTEIGAERRVYLASAAVIAVAVISFARFARPAVSRTVAVLVVGSLMVGTFVRSTVYADRDRLLLDSVAKAPGNPRAYFNAALSLVDGDTPRHDEAVALLAGATAVDSTYFEAWHYTGVIELSRGRGEEAAAAFGRAARLRPSQLDALDGLARAWLVLGQIDSAAVYAERVGSYDPQLAEAVERAKAERRVISPPRRPE
jgi:tetratricopeptide (TPR) repeat protein